MIPFMLKFSSALVPLEKKLILWVGKAFATNKDFACYFQDKKGHYHCNKLSSWYSIVFLSSPWVLMYDMSVLWQMWHIRPLNSNSLWPYLHSNKHSETDAEICPNLDTDMLEIDMFTLSDYSQDTAVIWPVFLVMCVPWSVCVCVCVFLLHRTGGRQQGWEQASEQVQYHWGGTNTVWTSPLLKGA